MKVLAEVFKGIEFIRISNLPEEQKNFILATVSNDKVIKILKDKIVLRDCLQYHDYLPLYDQYKSQRNALSHKESQLTYN
ncbi:MAG TPA: hypothetical protein VFE57_10880 [Cyclobacteriaceae bacterium]|jgi:hypothetical protein|nr:hypothetical protein [Cyclobacteriaceae bacterium]